MIKISYKKEINPGGYIGTGYIFRADKDEKKMFVPVFIAEEDKDNFKIEDYLPNAFEKINTFLNNNS